MLESYITPLLMSYVDKYIKNLKPSDLNLSLWGGDVSLSNLELDLHALEKELKLPITFLSGKIHELHIHVPWTKLYYEPAVITINTIECVLKLRETDFTSEEVEETTEADQEAIEPSLSSPKFEAESESPLPPGYVQSLLNKVIYNLTVRVNNFILKYVEDDIVLSLNIKSAELHSANADWVKEFVDVAAPDWILHKLCNISDLTVCLDRRNASGIIEMYQDPLAYKCNLSCRMQVYYDKEGFYLPLEKNVNVYCECLEVSITDQQLPLLLRLLKLGLSLYYGTLDLPGCELSPHVAKDLLTKNTRTATSGIISGLPGTFTPGTFTPVNVPSDSDPEQVGWFSWAMSMVPSMQTDGQKIPAALLAPQISRFGVYVSQAILNFKITEPVNEGNFLAAQRFVFKPILTIEAAGVASEMVTKGISFFDFRFGVTSLTGWLVDRCVCKHGEKGPNGDDVADPEEELFLKLCGKSNHEDKGVLFLKGSLFDQGFKSAELPEFVSNAEEFLRKNSEAVVLSRFGAMVFDYLYTMDVENEEATDYFESTPVVKEESHQRLIMGSSMCEITSDVVHRMELIMKLGEEDSNLRKEKEDIFYDEFVEDQLLSGNVTYRHIHVTVLDASLVIMTSDHTKTHPTTNNESLKELDTSLSEIQEEEEKEPNSNHPSVTTGCVFQVERLDLQRTTPMYPKELLNLIKQQKAGKTLLQHAHGQVFAKVFGFQIGVSRHDVSNEEPMILNVLPACNISLFAKHGLLSRDNNGLSNIEARLELPTLSLNVTKPQWMLLHGTYESWMTPNISKKVFTAGNSLIQDVFYPSAKQGGKIPVIAEAFLQGIKAQLLIAPENICSSGSIQYLKATVLSLSGEKTQSTPVLYGPLITTDIYNGKCFTNGNERSFLSPTVEPWFAFTLKIPVEKESEKLPGCRPLTSRGGAVLLKCKGTVVNLDPVLYSWLSYHPRVSSSSLAQTISNNKQLRRTPSQTRLMSAVTPRKKSYARGNVSSKSPSHIQKKNKKHAHNERTTRKIRENSGQDFDGWVWEKLPSLASAVIQVDVESFVVLAPSHHLPYGVFPASSDYDILRNFVHHLQRPDVTIADPSGLVVALPALKIRSSNHQDLPVCQDILRHPLTLPPREQAETLPWVLTADNTSVFTVWKGDTSFKSPEVYFVLNPMCSRAMLASASTSRSEAATSDGDKQHARLDFVVHTDFDPLVINCSKKQVDLLFQLYSSAVQLTSAENTDLSFQDSDTSFGARSLPGTLPSAGRYARRTASMTSSSGFELVEEESISSESTPKPVFPSPESSKVSPMLVRVSLWVQWTLPKLSLHVFGSSAVDGPDLRITTELEDLSASFDYQNGNFKAQCKVGNLCITHCQLGPSGQWTIGPGGGTLLSRRDTLSSSLSKTHTAENGNVGSDLGPHGFLYMEYSGSSVSFPASKLSKEISEHDELFENSFRYHQKVHVTIQPFDIILWCPMLSTMTTVFQRFTMFQLPTPERNEPRGIPSLDSNNGVLQSVTNLPEVNIKLRGFRLVVPSRIDVDERKGNSMSEGRRGKPDLFTVQGSSLLVTSHPDNPISRLVVNKKLSKLLRCFAQGARGRNNEGGSVGDVQYQLEVKGLRVWSGCWDELCRTLPRKDTAEIERDLLEQNPALEWNTYNAQEQMSTLIIPVVSEFDIKSVIAFPVSLCVSNKPYHWQKPIFGLSLELHLPTDLECFLSKHQVQLMHSILIENIINSGLPSDSTPDGLNSENLHYKPAYTRSHRSGVHPMDEKIDSGVGSESSFKPEPQRHTRKSRDVPYTAGVQHVECLVTAGALSVCVYDKGRRGGGGEYLVPVVRASFIQPVFTCTRVAESDTLQISCFDVSLAKGETKSSNPEEVQVIPASEDFNVVWFRTGDGSPDKRTELPPFFVNFKCKVYPTSPADLKLDFGRPMWIHIDLDLLKRLICFSKDLLPEQKSQVEIPSELGNGVRSMALSTNYVAVTLIAGDNQDSAPFVKSSFSSLNLGVSVKIQDEDSSQRSAANLNLCALTLSTSLDNNLRSLLLPYDASLDLEMFRVFPTSYEGEMSSPAVDETFVWLDSGLLQVNLGQEHVRCMNLFSDKLLGFIHSNLPEYLTDGDVNSFQAGPSPPVVQRSYDDLRTGPFQYITSSAPGTRPSPYEIAFTDDGPPTMSWRYPEPRSLSAIHIIPVPFTTFASYPSPVVMEEDRLLPCILRYWDNLQKSYVEHATFYISENSSTDVDLHDPMLSPLSNVVAASEWQVVANIAVAAEDSEASSDDGASSIASEHSHSSSPISATSLAACMKVDSIFCSHFVPTLSVSANINTSHVTVFNHLENIDDAVSQRFKGFNLQEQTPKEQEFVRLTAEGTTVVLKKWPSELITQLSFQLWSNVHADVLDYRDLRWSSLLSPVDMSLAVVKDLKTQMSDDKAEKIPPRLDLNFNCGDVVLDSSQSKIHTLATGLMGWQGVQDLVLSHFIICNNTNLSVRFGQFGTDENIVLRSKEMAFYSWRSRNDLGRQDMHLCLEIEGECRWCEPFGIDGPGVVNRVVHYGLHSATLAIEVQKKSGLQRQIILHSCHVVTNYTSHDIEAQLLQNPALTQITSSTLQVLYNIVVPSQSSSPSYVISHGGLAGIRVRMRGETTWSGTLPLEDQLPHYKQHFVVQMLGTKEFKNFYLWYNVTSVDNFFGQIEISFSPLFIIRNHLPQAIQMSARSAPDNVITTCEAPGEAIEHQVFDLPPDTWHYVTFKLKETQVSSNPPVPLNTTLYELFEVADMKKRDDESEEIQDAKWPYSSISPESSAKPYLKPTESTLVRHVRSRQNLEDEQLAKGKKISSSQPLELQCQIRSKWQKLRSIVLEIKPWSLVENKSSVPLHLKDEAMETIFDLEPGHVFSPAKLQSFCIGVLPCWLEEIIWSDSIHLVDSDQPTAVNQGLFLEQYAQLRCTLVLPGTAAPKISSFLITSGIVCGIRIITLEETTRIVCVGLPRPLLVQPAVINDMTAKIKKTMFSTDSQIRLEPGGPTDTVSSGIAYWDVFPEQVEASKVASDVLNVLMFALPGDPHDATNPAVTWSRPVRIQQGIVRQCVSLVTSCPGLPLAVVVITLIENGLIKVVVTRDQVPRILLTNDCAHSFQFGQCPSSHDKQKARKTRLSDRDLVISENLDMYTAVPRLDAQSSAFYEPPELRESFLTNKSQSMPKLRVQFLKQANIKELGARDGGDRIVDLPQGWSEAIDVSRVGKTTYNLPGNYRLHVEVARKTSFLMHVVFRDRFCERESSEEIVHMSSKAEVKARCTASSLSFCLHDESSRADLTEVLRVSLEDVSIAAARVNGGEASVELRLGNLQIDNQMDNDFYHFPVIVVPLENESRNSKRESKKSLKPLLSCHLDFTPNPENMHIHALSVELEAMSVFIEDTFLYRLAGMLDSFILPESERRESESDDDFRAMALASAVIKPVIIDRLDIAPLYVLLTFHASVKLFVSADHTPLYFQRFHMTSIFTDPSFLSQLLAVHYAYSALMKVGWIVGSLDIIGSPASLIRSLGQGLTDFFYLPYDGLTRGPAAFVTGITSGMSSFMSHISAGALTSITNLASSISRNMDRLTFDEQYIQLQEQLRAVGQPRRVLSGFTHGCSGFLLSVLCAIAGVADQPMQELFRAESVRDATSGIVTGVGKGLIGVVTKPLGGAMELVSQTGQGILQGTGLGETPRRLYEPERRGIVIGSNSHLKYFWKLLESKPACDNMLSVNVSVFVSGIPHFEAILILSSDSVLFVDRDDDTILKAYSLRQVDMREDPQHPRALLLEHHIAGADTISEVSSATGLIPTSQATSHDVTLRQNSRQSLADNDSSVLTLFMDPVYTQPLLSRFRLFKCGF